MLLAPINHQTDSMCSSRKQHKAKMMSRPRVVKVAARDRESPPVQRRAPCFTPTITKCMKRWGACVVLIHHSRSTRPCQWHTWGKQRIWMCKLPIGWHLLELRCSTATEEHHSTTMYFSCGGTSALHTLLETPSQFFLWNLHNRCGLCWIWASHGEFTLIFSCTNES